MVGTFACPECGSEVEPAGLAPGRQVRCRCCDTLVEVPFLPRVPGPRRSGRRSARRRAGWAWACGAVAVLVAVAGAVRAVRSFGRAAHEGHLAALVASARDSEAAGEYDRALVALEEALRLARPEDACADLGELRRHRDALSLREARGRLAAVPGLDRGQGVGECLTLLARSGSDPALAPLGGRLREELAGLARADLEDARRDLAASSPESALFLCERVLTATTPLSLGLGGEAREGAWAVAAAAVEGFGAVIDPIEGEFTFGSARSYDLDLRPILADGLRARNYVPPPPSSPFRPLWDERGPCHLAAELVETQRRPYLDTPHLTSQIDCRLTLSRGGQRLWHTEVPARTRPTVPGLSSYGLGRKVMGPARDPKVERLLYDDARRSLLPLVAERLRGLPEPGVSG